MNNTAFDAPVPYIVFDGEMARQERTVKRLWVLLIILIALFVGTNGAWLYYETLYNDIQTTITQEVDHDGNGDTIVSGTGEVNVNGESTTDNNNN